MESNIRLCFKTGVFWKDVLKLISELKKENNFNGINEDHLLDGINLYGDQI